MPTSKLSDARIRSAKPQARPYKLSDGLGLYLMVSTTGARSWRMAYRLSGKQQTLTFGLYPEVTLLEARQRCTEARAKLRAGADPAAEKRTARLPTITLDDACAAYWAGRADISPDYRLNAERALMRHVQPLLGDHDVRSLTREDVMTALRPMDAAGHYVYVRKVRMWLGQVLEWAVEQGYAVVNPADGIKTHRAFGKRPVEHFAAIPLVELGALMRRLAIEERLLSVLACRLLALTWVRTGELRMMTWAELDGSTWRIPAERMKRRRAHVVPLPSQALALLDELRARSRGSAYVFPAEHRLDRPMSDGAILMLLARLGYRGRMTGHGFRTLASTWANESGYSVDAIERQLAHAPDDQVRAAYNRAEFMPERARMLQAWADYLDGLEA